MPFAQRLSSRNDTLKGIGVTIVTKAREAIVTELENGPASARDLSQRLDGVSYANIRQTLSRLVKAGIVTKLRRGLYALNCENPGVTNDCDDVPVSEKEERHCDKAIVTDQAVAALIVTVWADFEAMNDPLDPRAWS